MHIMRQLSKNYTNKYDAVNIELFYSNVLSHCVCVSRSVMSDSLRPHGVQPTRLLCPWNSPGKNTGVGSHSLLQGIFLTQELSLGFLHCRQILYHLSSFSSVQFSSVAQLHPTLCDPMNRSTPGLPVHHHLPEFTQTHVHRVSDAIQPSHPLSSPSPPASNPSQHQGLFQ